MIKWFILGVIGLTVNSIGFGYFSFQAIVVDQSLYNFAFFFLSIFGMIMGVWGTTDIVIQNYNSVKEKKN